MYLFNLRFKDVKEKGLNSASVNKMAESTEDKEKKVTIDLPKKKEE